MIEPDALRVRRISKFDIVDSIILVGVSGVGKTTIGLRLKELLRGEISFPLRVSTRAKRQDDGEDEGFFCSPEEFQTMQETGKLGLTWRRSGNTDRYGFFKPESDKLPVYVATSSVVNNDSLEPRGTLNTALVIGIYAPENVKIGRLLTRWGEDLDLDYRLKDRAARIIPKVDVVVKNFGRYQNSSASDLADFLVQVMQKGGRYAVTR